ncbi:hypothetical protein ACFV4F_06365 [Kitasatospora sp. NPDC059722]|uniref:hypothetical protein n=1 Tax=unclassified Kitasatospora TaxID=2633591 RepID=UPI0036547655
MYWAGLLLCVLLGGEIGAIVAGIAADDVGTTVTLTVVGANLVPWTALGAIALLVAGSRRRAAAGTEPPRLEPAMARIEASRATGEGPDIPLRLDLTVAPTGGRAYRADATVVVNLMDLDDFRVGRTVVVDHDPARPWDVRVRRRPGAEFAGRVALTKIDTAPPETRQSAPRVSAAAGGRGARAARFGLMATGVGALLSLVPFHGLY